jgi:hypothetical protein
MVTSRTVDSYAKGQVKQTLNNDGAENKLYDSKKYK